MPMKIITCLFSLLMFAVPAAAEPHPGADAFVDQVVAEHGLDPDRVRAALADARYRQSIIDAMERPAEALPWHRYRNIFLTDTRIDAGVEFWRANQDLLARVEAEFEVPAEIVVAIVGVETNYGMNTGSYRVLDALATLGFYYPRRAEFFGRELGHFLLLADEEDLPLYEVKGSYAGAMGLGQFIPSSYRAYAVDFSGDGRRDLWRSLPDALGSVANYFRAHRWAPGAGVVLRARVDNGELPPSALQLDTTLAALAERGVSFDAAGLPGDTPAMLIRLEQPDGYDYWIGLNNFYVITRYNRSPLYAMAVYKLAQAIREARE